MTNYPPHDASQLVLNFTLTICGQALKLGEPITTAAFVGTFGKLGLENLGIFDLQRMEKESPSAAPEFVRELAECGRYGFVAFVSQGEVVDHPENASASDEGAAQDALVTIIYTDAGQAVAHHVLDKDNQRIIPGKLAYVGQAGVVVNAPFVRSASRVLH